MTNGGFQMSAQYHRASLLAGRTELLAPRCAEHDVEPRWYISQTFQPGAASWAVVAFVLGMSVAVTAGEN
jgi:hypothetical protein